MESAEDEDEGDIDSRENISFGKHWGWFGTLITLANEDITKVEEVTKYPLVFVLNYMAYMKDLNEMRDKERRKENLKNR